MGATDKQDLPYDELKKIVESLQAQVSQFITVRQDLVGTRDKLDSELGRFKFIQSCNEEALQAKETEDLTTIILEAVVESFEFELSAFLLYDPVNNRLNVINTFNLEEESYKLPFLPEWFSGKESKIIDQTHIMLKEWSVLDLYEAIICPFYNNNQELYGFVLGGTSQESKDYSEPITSDLLSSFTVMVNQAGSLYLNHELKSKIQEQNIQLKNYSKNLEQMVADRTDELNKTLEKVHQAHQLTQESIHYAKRIQASLLPNMEEVQSHLPESFFTWQPRDIVGGDIFVAEAVDNGFIVGVVDCTGHGVPGAFMTMLASSGIKRIIKDDECKDPAEILKQLNYIVKTSLRQDQQQVVSDDGMDAGFCFINDIEKTITFAGAKTPFIVVEDGEYKILKGDNQSLGYRHSDLDFIFTNQTIAVTPQMACYMFTDGIIDQPGDFKRFGFGRKRTCKILAQNYLQPFEQQEKILLEAYHKHRGDRFPVDDLTVVGFRYSTST
ncbi:MAG: SpoIIE family protein phosphatase [Magnetococcales bacterium]|nr:SpoIIE family protein phosphatase [Magnetococcales bacterium]